MVMSSTITGLKKQPPEKYFRKTNRNQQKTTEQLCNILSRICFVTKTNK